MSTSTYEHILRELGHLTAEERRRLRQALDDEQMTGTRAERVPRTIRTTAAEPDEEPPAVSPYVALLEKRGPLNPAVAAEMERAIADACERIEAQDG